MPAYTLTLTEEEWRVFHRPVNGQGGSQTLLRKLQACVSDNHRLSVEKPLLDRTYQYAYRYAASGGFQTRFKAVVVAALRAGWHPARRFVLDAA